VLGLLTSHRGWAVGALALTQPACSQGIVPGDRAKCWDDVGGGGKALGLLTRHRGQITWNNLSLCCRWWGTFLAHILSWAGGKAHGLLTPGNGGVDVVS